MRLSLVTTTVLPLLASTAAAQRSAPAREVDLPTPFVSLATPAPHVLELGYDALGTLERLGRARRADAPITMTGWALPGEGTVELLLRPVRVMAEGGTAVVHESDGSTSRLAPSVELFAGSVPGRASQVFLAFARDQVNGYVELDGQLWILTSGGDTNPGLAWIHRVGAAPDLAPEPAIANWCQTPAATGGSQAPTQELRPLLGAPQIRHAPVFMELDNRYRGRFGSNQAAIDYCVTLVGASSVIYRRDIGATLEIPDGYINLWNTTPPWGVLNDFGDISAVEAWWPTGANPNRDAVRAAVHVLTNPVFGGVASTINGLCSITMGYEVSSVNGSFPMPVQHTSSGNWDLIVVSHEFGHTFGAQHTFEIGVQCNDGSGPDIGTIMSYCHLNFGIAAIGMRFHRRSQDDIRFVLPNHPCIDYEPIERGDYDDDGDWDALDLAQFDAVQVQGFLSRGADEVFDMDADGAVDAWDREVLVARINGAPAASVTTRNGTGVNPECFSSFGPPVLGSTWEASVFTTGASRLTVLVGTAEPLAGQNTPWGQLLVRTAAFGGQTLLQLNRQSQFFSADYALAIPRDVALAGLDLYLQPVAFNTGGTQLCNALDLSLSFY